MALPPGKRAAMASGGVLAALSALAGVRALSQPATAADRSARFLRMSKATTASTAP